MVVCKCRKATKLYCFVHKQAVCHQCICSSEHEACVVKTYSEWVIDGDYDWPQMCTGCNNPVEEGQPLVRLGCLHIMHHKCLDGHLSSFPPTTAPAGFICPGCNSSIWPANVRDTSAMLFQRLKERIQQSTASNRLLGPSVVPPSMLSDPSGGMDNGDVAGGHGQPSPSKGVGGGGALARKGSKQPLPGGGGAPDEYAVAFTDDEGDSDRKYARRGNFMERVFRKLLPGVAPPSLPIHSGPGGGDERSSGARRRRGKQTQGTLDPRKLLLLFALLSCLATMVLLYTRIS